MTRHFTLLSLLVGIHANAQYHIPAEQLIKADLAAVNTYFAGKVTFTIDRQDRLIADHFDATGRFREDVVYVEFLQPEAFAFTAEESSVMMKCTEDHARCIDKELFKTRTISHTGRMNLPVMDDDADGAHALALLNKLVVDEQALIHDGAGATDRRNPRKSGSNQ